MYKLLFLLILNANPQYELYLSLEYHPSPVYEQEWKISIYRNQKSVRIVSENFQNKNFNRPLDFDEYIDLLQKLNSAGIWSTKSNYDEKYPASFYYLVIKSKKRLNLIKFYSPQEHPDNRGNYDIIKRTIENYATLYNPSNR